MQPANLHKSFLRFKVRHVVGVGDGDSDGDAVGDGDC